MLMLYICIKINENCRSDLNNQTYCCSTLKEMLSKNNDRDHDVVNYENIKNSKLLKHLRPKYNTS